MPLDILRHCSFLQRRSNYDGISSDLKRVGSEYHISDWFSDRAVFTSSDAISLAVLAARQKIMMKDLGEPDSDVAGRVLYYERGYDAVTKAIGISNTDVLPRLLANLAVSFSDTNVECAVEQLVRVRCMAISFQDEYGGMLEGDRWGCYGRTLKGEALSAAKKKRG